VGIGAAERRIRGISPTGGAGGGRAPHRRRDETVRRVQGPTADRAAAGVRPAQVGRDRGHVSAAESGHPPPRADSDADQPQATQAGEGQQRVHRVGVGAGRDRPRLGPAPRGGRRRVADGRANAGHPRRGLAVDPLPDGVQRGLRRPPAILVGELTGRTQLHVLPRRGRPGHRGGPQIVLQEPPPGDSGRRGPRRDRRDRGTVGCPRDLSGDPTAVRRAGRTLRADVGVRPGPVRGAGRERPRSGLRRSRRRRRVPLGHHRPLLERPRLLLAGRREGHLRGHRGQQPDSLAAHRGPRRGPARRIGHEVRPDGREHRAPLSVQGQVRC